MERIEKDAVFVYPNHNCTVAPSLRQGDRERITVFGPGAGAASAGLLAVMPRSRSMVRRVIAMSGSPLADWEDEEPSLAVPPLYQSLYQTD